VSAAVTHTKDRRRRAAWLRVALRKLALCLRVALRKLVLCLQISLCKLPLRLRIGLVSMALELALMRFVIISQIILKAAIVWRILKPVIWWLRGRE
jgi:hypothetical protein